MKAFGLVGLLVAIGIIALLMSGSLDSAKTGIDAKKKLEEKGAGALTREGREDSLASITLTPQPANGKVKTVLVSQVVPGGPMQRVFGLQAGDVITAAGGVSFDAVNADPEDAVNMVIEARSGKSLTVKRAGAELTLSPGK